MTTSLAGGGTDGPGPQPAAAPSVHAIASDTSQRPTNAPRGILPGRSRYFVDWVRSANWSAHELIQCRFFVGPGPSLKMWPRWPPHLAQCTSSAPPPTSRVPTEPGIASEKLGQPPWSNLVSLP